MIRAFLLAALLVTPFDGHDDPAQWPPGRGIVEPARGERIAWFGTLAAAQEEAARLQRPLFLTSAAPRCRNTPGVW